MEALSKNELHKSYRILRLIQVFCVILLASAVCVYTFNKWVSVALVILAFIDRLVFMVFKKRYTTAIVHISAEHTLEQHLKDSHHLLKAPLDADELRSVQLLPCDPTVKGITCCEGGTGSYEGIPVKLAGATFIQTYKLGTKTRNNYTVGTWVCAQLPFDTGLDCRFLTFRTAPETVLSEMLKSTPELLRLKHLPSGIKKEWNVLCREGNEALPDIGFCKTLEKLYTLTDGHAAVCVQGSKLHIMLEDEILAQDVSIREKPEKIIVPDLLPALSCALSLTKHLGVKEA